MLNSIHADFPDSLVDQPADQKDSGYHDPKGQDNTEELFGIGAREFSNELWIPRSEWKDWANENDKAGTWAENFRNRFTNQLNEHDCTCHSLLQGAEAAWNAERLSKKSAVLFSAMSVYAEANPNRWGGANCLRVLRIAMRRGFLPEHSGPDGSGTQKSRFKHTLQCTAGKGNEFCSRGKWTPVSRFPSGWKDTARHFKPLEVVNPENWEQAICLLLHGRVINVGRDGHAVPWNRVVWRDGRLYVAYSDSYDVIRYDSMSRIRRAIGGSSCIWSMQRPDDWDKPAGEDML